MSPRPPDMSLVRRILIVKLSSIGDVVHALPVSAALAESFPHVEVSWIVEEMAAPMVTGNPCLHEVIVVPAALRKQRASLAGIAGFLKLRRELRSRRFDVTLDLQGLSKSALVAWASGARRRFGYDWLRELAPLLEARVPRRPGSVHVVDQFLDVARFLGARVDRARFPIHIPVEAEDAVDTMIREEGVDSRALLIVINPSSGGGGHKGWGAARFAALIDSLGREAGMSVVLIGSRGDQEVATAVASAAGHPVISLVGRTDLKQLAALLRRAALHVCGDTGSAHIAAALETPVVTIFGRSNPDRLAPYGQREFAVHHRERCASSCRAFHDSAPVNSKQKCLEPPPACIAAVEVGEVLEACRRALERGRVRL